MRVKAQEKYSKGANCKEKVKRKKNAGKEAFCKVLVKRRENSGKGDFCEDGVKPARKAGKAAAGGIKWEATAAGGSSRQTGEQKSAAPNG